MKRNIKTVLGASLATTATLVALAPQVDAADYTIKFGDTLSELAQQFNTTVSELQKTNNIKDANLIYAGNHLTVPDAVKKVTKTAQNVISSASRQLDPDGRYHVIAGDTLNEIAKEFNTTVESLRQANGISGNLILVGQKLQVPTEKAPEASQDNQNVETSEVTNTVSQPQVVSSQVTTSDETISTPAQNTAVEKTEVPEVQTAQKPKRYILITVKKAQTQEETSQQVQPTEAVQTQEAPKVEEQSVQTVSTETNDVQKEQQAKADQLAAQKAAQKKAKADQLAAQKAAQEKAKADQLAAQKAAQEKAKADQLAAQKAAQEKAKADQLAAQKAAQEKAKADQLAAQKAAQEKAKADQLAAQKAAQEKAKADQLAAQEKAKAQQTATTQAAPAASHTSSAIGVAQQFLGVPYLWGGSTPSGFDCSGLVQYAFAKVGVNLPRTSQAQSLVGTPISVSQAQPGDLLFWGARGSSYHVAIYMGNNTYINAPKPGDVVKVATISPYFMPTFATRL